MTTPDESTESDLHLRYCPFCATEIGEDYLHYEDHTGDDIEEIRFCSHKCLERWLAGDY